MVSAKSVAAFGTMLLGNVMAADNMGPAAFLWPPDREWSADADSTAPCGSTKGVGVRTEFPLGKLFHPRDAPGPVRNTPEAPVMSRSGMLTRIQSTESSPLSLRTRLAPST